ncbi:MAG: EAL domain-containing protein [Ruminococcus sp.]|nr:EAL domain-containing protein [Ruminococcus sp.]
MTFIITKNNITGNNNVIVLTSSDAVTAAAEDYFDTAAIPLHIMAKNAQLCDFLEDPSKGMQENIADDMRSLVSSYSNAAAIWCVSGINGEAVSDRGYEGQVDTSDDWFEEAAEFYSEYPRIYLKSEGHNSFIDCDSQIIMVMPVNKDGEFIGCVGTELTIDGLSERIGKNLYYDGFYAAVINENDSIVCAISNINASAQAGFNTSEVIETSRNSAIQSIRSGSTTSYAVGKLLANGWRTSVIYDGYVADGNFAKMYVQQIVILICLFVLELIATLNVIRHEAKDIPEISGSIAEISAGNYNFRINSASRNEIGLIAQSVDNLAQTLQDKNAVIDDYTNLDPTTGLQNRYKMYEYMDDLIISRDETRKRFALLFIDIDNFKWITETLGHRQGDEFLKIFGQRLKSVVPRVFRFSGDEFIILTEFNDDYGIVDELVLNLRSEFIEPIEILNDKLYAQFSVGISVYPDDDANPDMLLRDADIAMSRAKEKGKGRTSYYNASLHKNVLSKATIAQKLNSALENNEMFLNFQPIISVSNGDIHGFEVLIRWESDELGYVQPFTFVQIAEETGAIVEIGTWIFESACRYLKEMNEYNKDIIMSINVSPIQLKKKDFLEKVIRTIEIFQINPQNIQIEITETSLVEFIDGSNDVIQKIADMGIALALDDFGTGYSSFGYLKDMPIKTLKVDKSFVDEICSKNKDYQITGSIIDMVRNLGIKTVVEGVESIEQYNILRDLGCDYIQGFLMSKPLSATDAMEFVMRYDEFHKPNQRSLEENSNKLAAERLEKERKMKETHI